MEWVWGSTGFGSFWFKRQEPPVIPSLHLVGLRNSVQISRDQLSNGCGKLCWEL